MAKGRSQLETATANGPRTPGFVEITIVSAPKCLPIVRAAVQSLAESAGFTTNDAHTLVLATDEALTNVIRHGYQNRTDQPISIALEPVTSPDGRCGVRITVRDFGRQVDPGSIKGRDLDDIRPGGLGVHIIRSVMDEVIYACPIEGGMLLTMVKFAGMAPGTGAGEACEDAGQPQ